MAIYGYVRVSSADQNEDRQILAMGELEIPSERIFMDKLSGKSTARPGLQQLLATVQKGDTVIVESVSRFARNTKDLLDLIDKLTAKGVDFVSQKEHIDTTTPTGKFMLTVFGAVAELERGYILQRQKEGIKAAKARGVKFGRPKIKRPPTFEEVKKDYQSKKYSSRQAAEFLKVSQHTFLKWIRK